MKKPIALVVAILSITAYSFATENITNTNNTSSNPLVIPSGLPAPDSGIQIVPFSTLISSFTDDMKKEAITEQQQLKLHGYIEKDNPDAKYLLSSRQMAAKQKKMNYAARYGEYDTSIKDNYKEIKLAFPFHGIGVEKNNIIGYAASGSWRNGWTGINVFFENNDIDSSCLLSLRYIKLTHGAVYINRDVVKYDVNAKVTTTGARGNSNSGFTYNISWYDPTFYYDLECANVKYDSQILQKMTDNAKVIDKFVNN